MRRARLLIGAAGLAVVVAASGGATAPPDEPGAAGRAVVLTGVLEVTHGDDAHDAAHHAYDPAAPGHVLPDLQYALTAAGGRYLLEFDGHPPAAHSGDNVKVSGRENRGRVRVEEMSGSTAAAGGKPGGGGGGGKPKPATTFLGERDMLVIPVSIGADANPYTTAEITSAGFTGARSVAAYYQEISFGRTTLRGAVTQTYTIAGSNSTCDHTTWERQATAAAGVHWDLTTYEHIVLVLPHQADCGWGGRASIGGRTSWLNGTIAEGTWVHEIGHNLRQLHARTLTCQQGPTSVAAGGACTFAEYGDPYDVMGTSANMRHFSGRNKAHDGFIDAAKVVTATSGQHTLQPIELATTGTQVLRVPRGSSDYLYVELRTNHGFDVFAATDEAVTGVLVRSGGALGTLANTYLIDTTPYTANSWADAALEPGEAFVDPVGRIRIDVISVGGGTAEVTVTTAYANAGPTAVTTASSSGLLPSLPRQHPGGTASDGDLNLSSYVWTWVSCPQTCPAMTNAAGALSKGSAPVPGPLYVPTDTGAYKLALTVWDTLGASTTVHSVDNVSLL